MIGCRSLTKTEIETTLNILKTPRDKALFVTCLYTGFRITEVLSLKWIDVLNPDLTYKNEIKVSKRYMKQKTASRSVPMHNTIKASLELLYGSISDFQHRSLDSYVFRSNKGCNKPIDRIQAYKRLVWPMRQAGIGGAIGLHSTRKTFAKAVYERLGGDLLKTSKALGHKYVSSTVSYLNVDQAEIDDVIMNVSYDKK